MSEYLNNKLSVYKYMRKLLIIISLIFIVSGLSAQKIVRDSIRSGNKAFTEQRYNEAERNYKSAITKDPQSKEASYNLANTYYKQSKWDEAIKEYQHYLTLESDNKTQMGAAWHNIGNTQLKKKELQLSMEAYKNALRLNPADEEARYNLAVVQKIIKDKEDQDKDKDKDKNQDKDQKDKDKNEQQKNQPQPDQGDKDKKEKKPEQQEGQQLSPESAKQILQALEQDEKETQEKVKQIKAQEKKQQNENNRKQNKDW